MELFLSVLAVIWLLGVVAVTVCVGVALKHDDSDEAVIVRSLIEIAPVRVALALTVLILGWPATIAIALATNRK
jgi:hypothetical protein